MNRMGLPAFLRNMIEPSTSKATRLFQRAKPKQGSGYDYFRGLKAGCKKLIVEDCALDEAVSELWNVSDPTERATMTLSLTNLYHWKLKNPGKYFIPPSGAVFSLDETLVVDLKPEFGWQRGGKREVIQLWGFRNDRLPQGVGRLGAHVLKTRLGLGQFQDCNFVMHDLHAEKRYNFIESGIKSNETILQAELNMQAYFLRPKDAA
jgi:hypothetical protein